MRAWVGRIFCIVQLDDVSVLNQELPSCSSHGYDEDPEVTRYPETTSQIGGLCHCPDFKFTGVVVLPLRPESVSLVVVIAEGVHAHGGGLDAHHDHKSGEDHCYQGLFAGQYVASIDEILAALEATIQEPKKDTPAGAIDI